MFVWEGSNSIDHQNYIPGLNEVHFAHSKGDIMNTILHEYAHIGYESYIKFCLKKYG